MLAGAGRDRPDLKIVHFAYGDGLLRGVRGEGARHKRAVFDRGDQKMIKVRGGQCRDAVMAVGVVGGMDIGYYGLI